jgi:hypothetical protein
MSLSTGIDNPAQRLYERLGFQILATKRDAEYTHYAGSPGRVFMAKVLTH